MNRYSYHERAMTSGKKWTIIRSARRTGRTWLCLQWALAEPNKRVAFVSPSMRGNDVFIGMIKDTYPGLITMHNGSLIVLANGTSIQFISGRDENLNGYRFDKIAFDEAGYINYNTSMAQFIARNAIFGTRFLITASHVSNDTVFDWCEKEARPDAYYEEYSCYDALKDGVYTESFIEEMRRDRGEVTFKNEYGPWNTINKFGVQRNKDYKHLLKKKGAY